MGLAGSQGIAAHLPGTAAVPVAGQLLPALLLVPVGYVAARETRAANRPSAESTAPADALPAAAVTVAAPITRWLAVDLGVGVVVGSALVGLLAGLLYPRLGAAAYCGSFVGMAGPAVLPGYTAVIAAGAVAGLVYVAATGAFDGFGGKLGTTAFVGCGVVVLGTGATPGNGAMPGPTMTALLVAVAGAAAVATFAISVRLGYGPVIGSAVVGLVVGVAAPPLLPAGGTVAAVAFCASFVGMVSPDRLPNESATLLAGLVSGGLFVATMPAFAGLGGKLGTIAFTACLATAGLLSVGRAVDAARRRTASG